jgi:hypothetical protein
MSPLPRPFPQVVIAGLVPATPIMGHGRAVVIGVAGTSPAMTVKPREAPYSPAAAGSGMARPRRSFLSNSASRKASSVDCSALSRGSQKVW